MPNGAGRHQPLQRPNNDQHDEYDELDANRSRARLCDRNRSAPRSNRDVVRNEGDRHDAEHRHLGRDFHAERYQRRDHP